MDSVTPCTREADDFSDRVCWICLESGLSAKRNDAWCHPCRCKGALKWVHHYCLQRWIDEQQTGRGTSTPASCRVCRTQYEIIYPESGAFYLILEALDARSRVICYYVTGSLVLGSFYWSAVTFGAVTVMQVYGHHHGLQAMEQTDPNLLLLALPSIPICLILANAIPWQRALRSLWRRYLRRWTIMGWFSPKTNWPSREEATETAGEGFEFPRALCGALALPTIASLMGRIFFQRVRSDFYRTISGGLVYLSIKGLLSVSYQEMRYTRLCSRVVKNFEEQENSVISIEHLTSQDYQN